MTSAEGSITSAEGSMTSAEGSITSAEGSRRAIVCAIITGGLLGLCIGTLIPILALTMHQAGLSATSAGWLSAASAGGGIVGLLAAPRVFAHLPAGRVLGYTLVLAAGLSLFYLFTEPGGLWFVLRMAQGTLFAVAFAAADFWLAARAPARRRGAVLGIYGATIGLGVALGPQLATLARALGVSPWLCLAVIGVAGLLMTFAAGDPGPRRARDDTRSALGGLLALPLMTCAALAAGAMDFMALTLAPVHGARLGMSTTEAASLVSLYIGGGIVLAPFVGRLADAIGVRRVMTLCAGLGLALALSIAAGAPPTLLLIPLGACSAGLYLTSLALLARKFALNAGLAAATVAFNLAYTFGALAGTPAGGAMMDALQTPGLPLAFALPCVLVVLACIVSLAREPKRLRPPTA